MKDSHQIDVKLSKDNSQEFSLMYSNKSTPISKYKKKVQINQLAIVLIKIVTQKILKYSFQSIISYALNKKNKALIQNFVQNKKTLSKKQPISVRRIQTVKKQKQEEFSFDNENLSTIMLERQTNNSLSEQSRLYLQSFLEMDSLNFNKFTTSTYKIGEQGVNQHKQIKISRIKLSGNIQKLNVQDNIKPSISKNYYFDYENIAKRLQKQKNIITHPSKDIKLTESQTKQTQNSQIHCIYIFRQSSPNSIRSCSQPNNLKKSYIQMPLQSRNIRVVQMDKIKRNKVKLYSSQKNLIKCLSQNTGSTKQSEKKCEHCQKVARSFQMIRKFQKYMK